MAPRSNLPIKFVLALVLALLSPALHATGPATLHLANGQSLAGTIVGVEGESLLWKGTGASSTIKMPFANFAWLELRGGDDWQEAEDHLADGNLATAIEIYKQIADDRTARRAFPAIGNHATLAQKRLLDCYRELLDTYSVGFFSREMRMELLAPRDALDPMLECWMLAGRKVPEPAIQRIEEVLATVPKESPEALELLWLKGRTHALAHENSAALGALCQVFTVNAGAERKFAPLALRDAIELLAELPGRGAEAQSMLRLYTINYGQGKLWEGAPTEFTELHDREFKTGAGINFFGSEDDTSMAPSGKGADKPVVAGPTPGSPTGEDGGSGALGPQTVAKFNFTANPGPGISHLGAGKTEAHKDSGEVGFISRSTGADFRAALKKNYEPGFRYRCTVTVHGGASEQPSECFVALGRIEEGEFQESQRQVQPNALEGKKYSGGAREASVEFAVTQGSSSAGKPIAIQFGTIGTEVSRFLGPVVITRTPTLGIAE